MKEETLHISLIQTALHWEKPDTNLQMFERYFEQIPENCDLVVLPEMFTTGFTMNPVPVAETMTGETVAWLKRHSKKRNYAICGSIIISENSYHYNRFLFVRPDGSISYYDKRHTFNMAGEGKKYKAGKMPIIIDYRGWRIFPQICYDLRFPVFSRNKMGYDLSIYVANWPKTRIDAWNTLLKARAIENMSYVVGVNRTGVDGNHLEYVGHSEVYDPLGKVVNGQSLPKDLNESLGEKIISVTLSRKRIQELREKLPFLQDQDAFTLE